MRTDPLARTTIVPPSGQTIVVTAEGALGQAISGVSFDSDVVTGFSRNIFLLEVSAERGVSLHNFNAIGAAPGVFAVNLNIGDIKMPDGGP